MQKSEILNKIQTVFDEVFMDEVSVKPELSADEVEEWDSLTNISLIIGIEKAFGISFDTGEIESTKNIHDLMMLIGQKSA